MIKEFLIPSVFPIYDLRNALRAFTSILRGIRLPITDITVICHEIEFRVSVDNESRLYGSGEVISLFVCAGTARTVFVMSHGRIMIKQKMAGHYHYYGINGNMRGLQGYYNKR